MRVLVAQELQAHPPANQQYWLTKMTAASVTPSVALTQTLAPGKMKILSSTLILMIMGSGQVCKSQRIMVTPPSLRIDPWIYTSRQ